MWIRTRQMPKPVAREDNLMPYEINDPKSDGYTDRLEDMAEMERDA